MPSTSIIPLTVYVAEDGTYGFNVGDVTSFNFGPADPSVGEHGFADRDELLGYLADSISAKVGL